MIRDANNKSASSRSGADFVKKTLGAVILFGTLTFAVSPLLAQSQSFTGTFAGDDDNPGFSFSLSASAPVTIRTFSYAGGTNSAGAVIPEGGFDPTLSLFDRQGNFIVGNRDGGCNNVSPDSVTSFCWDAYLNITLPAGSYTVVVTQSENLPKGPTLSNSFVYSGQSGFTTPPGATSARFWDLFPSKRTAAYAFDILSSALVPPTVIPPPATLSFISSGNLGGFIPSAKISGNFAVSGGTGPDTWSATGLPAGLSLNTSTGDYSGTAGNPGVYNFAVHVTDSGSPPASADLNVTYSVLGIATSALPNASTASAYSASVVGIGGTGPYSFSASGLPTGLSMSPSGAISGTPGSSGTFTVIVQVASGGLTTSSTFALIVAAPSAHPLTVSSATLPAGTVSSVYSTATGLQASGGVPPYTWSVFGGIVPVGMSLSAQGNLQGTPTLAATYSFTAQVRDSLGATATGLFSLVIDPSPLVFSLGTFPTGIVGVTYPLQILTALPNGGQPPFKFTVSDGHLPPGLILVGQEIAGTPATPGTFSFTITATDSAGKTMSAPASITILSARTTLILSESTVSFSLTAGAGSVPTPAHVTVRSSDVGTVLNYSYAVSTAVSWLDVSGGSITPGSLTIAVDPTAPSLAVSATPYSTVITVTCAAPSPCAGDVRTINVSLSVTAPLPQLSLTSSMLSFTAFNAVPAPSTQPLGLQNIGGGNIDVHSITTGAAWLTVTGAPANLTAGPGATVLVSANPSGLSAGYYTTTLTVDSSAGIVSIPVTLLVAESLTMTVQPAGAQYSAQAGSAPGNTSGSFNVSAVGTGTLSWSASLAPGANWVTLNTTSGTSTSASAGSVSYSLNPDIITALAPATYYATITVTAAGVPDPLQQYQIVLDIMPLTDAVTPVLSSAGLIFTASSSGTTGSQTVAVYSGSAGPITLYQASAATTDGAPWLTVTPPTGLSTRLKPAQSTVSVNAASLAPGVYSGGVSYAFSGDAVSTVNVTLLVLRSGSSSAARGVSPEASTSCTPTKLIGTQTGLYNNFAQAAGWPTPLIVNLMDDCGAPVNGASLTTTFSNGDPPMALSPRDSTSGNYIGTWTPRNASPQVTVTATARIAPFPAATSQVTGAVRTGNSPILTPGGTLDVFNPVIGAPLAPGQVVQIYGTNLAAQTLIAPVPLPTSLGGTSVLIGGLEAPLFYVSPGQIDAQVPFGLTPGTQYQILVSANGALSTPAPVQVVGVVPNLANLSGQALATHLDGSLISADSPTHAGEFVVLYLSGLGATSNPVPSGGITPSPTDPSLLSVPLVAPTLKLNNVTVPTVFVGLTPTAVGLYQIDFKMPADVTAGNLELYVVQGDGVTNTVLLAVQ